MKILTPEDGADYQAALDLIENYQNTKEENDIDSHFISKKILVEFLKDDDFDAFKIHHAQKDGGTRTLVFEGVDKKGKSLKKIICDIPDCPPVCHWCNDDDDDDNDDDDDDNDDDDDDKGGKGHGKHGHK